MTNTLRTVLLPPLAAALSLLSANAWPQTIFASEDFGDNVAPTLAGWYAFDGGPLTNGGDDGIGDHAVRYIADQDVGNNGFHFRHPATGQAPNPDFQGNYTTSDEISVKARHEGFGSTVVLRLVVFDFSDNWAQSLSTCTVMTNDSSWRTCTFSLDPASMITSGPSAITILSAVRQVGFRHDPAGTGPGVPVPVAAPTRVLFDDVQIIRNPGNPYYTSVWLDAPPSVGPGEVFDVTIAGDFGALGLAVGGVQFAYDPSRLLLLGYEPLLDIDPAGPSCPGAPACPSHGPGRLTVTWVSDGFLVLPGAGPTPMGVATMRASSSMGETPLALDNEPDLADGWFDTQNVRMPVPELFGASLAVEVTDGDGDGVADFQDNCTQTANPAQIDADADNIGNRCDQDLNNDCIVNVVDLGLFRTRFFSADPVADFNYDGVVNVVDLGALKLGFFSVPGPSGLANACEP